VLDQKELRKLGFQLIGSSKDKAELEKVIQVETNSGHKKKYHLIQGEKGLWYLYALDMNRNPLIHAKVSDLNKMLNKEPEPEVNWDYAKYELDKLYKLRHRNKDLALVLVGKPTKDGYLQIERAESYDRKVRGVGTLLFSKLVDLSKKMGYKGKLYVQASPFAVPFYQKIGMRKAGKYGSLAEFIFTPTDAERFKLQAKKYIKGKLNPSEEFTVGPSLINKSIKKKQGKAKRREKIVYVTEYKPSKPRPGKIIKYGTEWDKTPFSSAIYEKELLEAFKDLLNRHKKRIIVLRRYGRRIYTNLRKAVQSFRPKDKIEKEVSDLIYQRRYMKSVRLRRTRKAVEETEDISSGKKKGFSSHAAHMLARLTSVIIKIPAVGKALPGKKWLKKKVTLKRNKFRRLYMVMAWRVYKGKDIIFPHWFAISVMKRLRKFPEKLKKSMTVKLKKVGPGEYRVIVKKHGQVVIYGKKNPAGFFPVPPVNDGEIISIYYPLTGRTFKAKALGKSVETDGIWSVKIRDGTGNLASAVWNDSSGGWIYGQIQNPRSKEVVVSDIDDTIIDSRDRELNACRNSKNTAEWWAQYNNPANFKLDHPINSMWELLQKYAEEGKQIIYLSYRPEGLRGVTQQQLIDFEFPPGELILCPTDDYGKKDPALFKLEWLKRIEKRKLKVIRVLEDNASIIQAFNNAGYTTIAPGSVPMQPNPKRLRENSTKMQKLLVKNHPLQKFAAEWKDKRGWKDLNKAEAMALLKSTKAVQSLKMDGELECVAVDLKKGIKVGNRRYKCVIANKTTMSRKKEGGVWHESMRTGKVRTGGPICDEMVTLCRRAHIRRFIGFGELYGHNNGRRVPFGDTAHYISTTLPKLWKKHVRLALFDIYAINGKLYNRPYIKAMKLLRKKFSGIYVQTALFKYGSAITFRKVWKRWIETQGNEGLVITIGKKAYKVKPSLSVDGVIIALKKTGIRWKEKRLASAFKTAVMGKKGEYIEIADVGNGFTDVERAKLTKLIIKNKVGEDKDYIYCKPTTVIEVAGMEKSKSRMPTIQVYDKRLRPMKKMTGWSIRMPRFIRYRTDKTVIYKDIRSEQLYDAGGVQSWSEKRII